MAWCLTSKQSTLVGVAFTIASLVLFSLASGLPNWDFQCLNTTVGAQSGKLCRKVGLWEFCILDDLPDPVYWNSGPDGLAKDEFECLDVEPGGVATQNGLRYKYRVARGFSILSILFCVLTMCSLGLRGFLGIGHGLDKALRKVFLVLAGFTVFFGLVTTICWVEISTDDEGSSNLNGLHDFPTDVVPIEFQTLFQAERSEGQYGSSFGLHIGAWMLMLVTMFWVEANYMVDKDTVVADKDIHTSATAAPAPADDPAAASGSQQPKPPAVV